MNGAGICQHGSNGCVTTQDIKERVVKMEVQQKNNVDDIKTQWKNLDAMQKMLNKFLIGVGVIFVLLNLAIKFIPIGN